jgi:hypothetical protein
MLLPLVLIAWLVLLIVFVALCRSAATGDARLLPGMRRVSPSLEQSVVSVTLSDEAATARDVPGRGQRSAAGS